MLYSKEGKVDKDNLNEKNFVELVPEESYSVKAFLIHDEQIVIPEDEECISKGDVVSKVTGNDEECFDLPEVKLSSFITGGLEIDKFSFDLKDLKFENLHINLIYQTVPRSHEDLYVV